MHLKHFSRFLMALGVFLIAAFVSAMIAGWLLQVAGSPSMTEITGILRVEGSSLAMFDARVFRWSQGISNLLGFFLPALILPLLFREKIRSFLALTFPGWSKIIESVLLLAVSIPMLTGLIAWNEGFEFPTYFKAAADTFRELETLNNRIYEQILRMENSMDLFTCILVMAVIPALGEEWFFRGVLYKIFQQWTGKAAFSVLLSALIFTLIHVQIFKFVPMLLLGLLLGALRWWSGSIWPSVVVHFINNLMAVVGAWVVSKQGNELSFLDKNYVFPAAAQWVSAILFALLAFRYWMNREQRHVQLTESAHELEEE